ncbi:Transcriptional regulatory protein, C terminal [Sphingomonas sp. NFR04]|uniref:winged helix-turn-helix domain-containing protein n=1 Tax=Sphingomonas sp. NFR04 TaxID=1566283 RepID=UPI0008EBE0F5|nr:transcriptional regulator [Sphingomonas sp. NFR04]SFJ66112.1 Transcriptional regulatory protein, C terminal [Sphingomonas sp. NFR04]
MPSTALSVRTPSPAYQAPLVRAIERCFRFGPFVLKPGRQLLLKHGVPVKIGARALDILTVLAERPGEVVSKRELRARTWPDTFVGDGNLKVHVASLRKVLGEVVEAPSYIATVTGRGYRFIADVQD